MISDAVVTLTDPVWEPPTKPGPFARLFGRFVRDERDLPFVRLTLLLLAIFVPLTVYFFIPGNFRWWMAPIYWALYLWFMGPFVLMLHNTSHRALFNRKYKRLNKVIPWGVGLFFGQSPETYFAHHIGMHHTDGNLPADLSSTMRFQRDSFRDFLEYYFTFLCLGVPQLYRYLQQRGRAKMARRFLIGEAAFLGLTAIALVWSWQPALVVFVVPLFLTRFLLMAGNWAQHAFIDPGDPTNDYKTVVTFINSTYNRRCFNDGYHLGHHLKATRHWTEMPADFLEKREQMVKEGSLVFRKIDYFQIFLLLMLKRHRWLAGYHVNIDPESSPSEDEVVALLKQRLERFDEAQLAALPATS